MSVVVALRSRNEAMRRARNAQAYADADYRTRDGWRETAAAYAIAARRHNWQLVRALRNFR